MPLADVGPVAAARGVPHALAAVDVAGDGDGVGAERDGAIEIRVVEGDELHRVGELADCHRGRIKRAVDFDRVALDQTGHIVDDHGAVGVDVGHPERDARAAERGVAHCDAVGRGDRVGVARMDRGKGKIVPRCHIRGVVVDRYGDIDGVCLHRPSGRGEDSFEISRLVGSHGRARPRQPGETIRSLRRNVCRRTPCRAGAAGRGDRDIGCGVVVDKNIEWQRAPGNDRILAIEDR